MKEMELKAAIQSLQEFDTALLANTVQYIDSTPCHELYMGRSIQSVTPTLGPSVGVAVICELDSSTPEGAPNTDDFWRQLEQMQKMDVPTIWVVKAVGNRPEHECALGDGMATLLYSVGCVALVTDGGVRDVSGLLSVPFAAYSQGKTVHHCALRFKALNEAASMGGIDVSPGDILHADSEGVIRIPRTSLPALHSAAARMRSLEHEARALFRRNDVEPKVKRAGFEKMFSDYGFMGEAGERLALVEFTREFERGKRPAGEL
jgi:4-hydroxy-4-methyl-2-oxoglutarate aldolase